MLWLCRFYVVLAFVVIIVASIIGIFLPLYEARGITMKVSPAETGCRLRHCQ